jgi:hypothetical protein
MRRAIRKLYLLAQTTSYLRLIQQYLTMQDQLWLKKVLIPFWVVQIIAYAYLLTLACFALSSVLGNGNADFNYSDNPDIYQAIRSAIMTRRLGCLQATVMITWASQV